MSDPIAQCGQDRPLRGLFITFGSFSLINANIFAALERARADIVFDRLDVSAELRHRPLHLARIAGGTLSEYGLGTLGGKAVLRYRALRSRAFFAAAHEVIAEAVASGRYDFTLQTQSLFDAATPGIPNFIYTDHVAAARLDQADGTHSVGRSPSPAWLGLERGIYRNAAHVFVFGTSIRNRLVHDYGIAPDHVSAVGAGALPVENPDTSPDRYASRRILFVGVEWERKGGPELIEAFRRLRARLPDATLTVVGCMPSCDVPGFEAVGRISREDVDRYFRDSACFCMPSRVEPFGIVYAEAMKHCRPVVACRVGDVADLVAHGETGLLVPPGDVAALADALETVLRDPGRARAMGLAGQARAARFDWNVIAEKIAGHLPRVPTAAPAPALEKALP